MTHPILELQAADTMSDQLRHRRDHLAEREQVRAARNALIRWDQARTVMRNRLDELTRVIEQAERDSHEIDDHRARLEQQMRTIIAPREAEALQHEIATLNERRSGIDDQELAALEEQSRLDDDLTALLQQEGSLRDALMSSDAVMSSAEADIDGELHRIDERLSSLRSAVEVPLRRKYDRLRKQNVVAAAVLAGSRCDGCHLDLSPAEVDGVRETAADKDGVADCPHCGRILVV